MGCESAEGVLTITLNRRERANVFTVSMAREVDSLAIFSTSQRSGTKGVRVFLEKSPARFSDRASSDMPPFLP